MTYLQKYNTLIQFRKEHPISELEYSEIHHIKPKCLFPELVNDSSNLIALTASEHFKAHYYLWKHYSEETNDKNAAIKMHAPIMRMYKQVADNMTTDEIEIAAKMFEEARIEQANIARNRFKGIPRSDEVKKKISESEKGKFVSFETRQKLRRNMIGNRHALGHTMSNESKTLMREKLSKKLSGKNNPAFGRHWYTNGIENIYIYDIQCPEGFWAGMTRKSKMECK